MIQRRRYLQAALCGLHTLPGFAGAQTAQRVYRVGVLRLGAAPESPSDVQIQGIPNALRDLGYVSGRNLWLDQRWSGGDREHLAAIAREMVGARTDVINLKTARALGLTLPQTLLLRADEVIQ